MEHPLLIRLGKFTFVGSLIVALSLPVVVMVPRWALLFEKLLQFVTGCDHIRAYPPLGGKVGSAAVTMSRAFQ